MMGTTVLFWKLTKALLPKEERIQIVSVWVFAALTTIPLLEGQTPNAELFITGPLIWGALLVFVAMKKPKIKSRIRLSKTFLFVTAWLFLSLFAVMLFERPRPHHLILSVPPAAILIGFLALKKNWEQTLSIIPLFALVAVPVIFNFRHYDSVGYYGRFLRFATGAVGKEAYFSEFNSRAPRDYKLAQIIATTTAREDPVFIWEDSVPIYALSRRLPPARKETIDDLASSPPKLVVILPESSHFSELRDFVAANYFLINEVEGAQIWKRADINFQ